MARRGRHHLHALRPPLLRTIIRRDNGESCREMLARMAQASGIETPTADDLARFDRKRKGKTLSNADWKSPTDPDARITKMKDGTTHLFYKAEHAVDPDTVVVVAAPIHPADEGDTATLSSTLKVAERNLGAVGLLARLNCQKLASVSETERPRFSSADRSEAASTSLR
jgi:hypothetical protein